MVRSHLRAGLPQGERHQVVDGARAGADRLSIPPKFEGGRPVLKIEHVSKVFSSGTGTGTLEVLRDINLDVAEGEFVSLLGPSGCGKTTLLKIVGGLVPATSGAIHLNGQLSMKPSRDNGFVFQHFNLFPWRTVLGNAVYGLELQGVGTAAERNEKALSYLRALGLEGFHNHFPAQISGGMKQRVGIARALLINPRVLLMDEPFGALDALTREVLQEELLRIVANEGRTVVFVTHSIDEAIYLSDRIVVMGRNPGKIMREFKLTLPKPRWEYNFRKEPEYIALREEIWELLRQVLANAG